MNYAINSTSTIKKMPGKGGWHYCSIPPFDFIQKNPFGWIIVNGYIENVELNEIKIMPMGDGTLFLPLNQKLRTKLNKTLGDKVNIKLKEAFTHKVSF